MEKVFEIASRVSNPLMLAGVIAAAFFFILREIIRKNIFPTLNRNRGAEILILIIERLFMLALVSIVLGFAGFVMVTAFKANERASAITSTPSPTLTPSQSPTLAPSPQPDGIPRPPHSPVPSIAPSEKRPPSQEKSNDITQLGSLWLGTFNTQNARWVREGTKVMYQIMNGNNQYSPDTPPFPRGWEYTISSFDGNKLTLHLTHGEPHSPTLFEGVLNGKVLDGTYTKQENQRLQKGHWKAHIQ